MITGRPILRFFKQKILLRTRIFCNKFIVGDYVNKIGSKRCGHITNIIPKTGADPYFYSFSSIQPKYMPILESYGSIPLFFSENMLQIVHRGTK